MTGKERYFYPGNNTPRGFYSYYDYVMDQTEANKIFCMKGGPGTGKSTFMKQIGKEMASEGWDVDYLLCSSDPGSLDGIIIKKKKIAILDGTAPHVVDPRNPGAVDEIINLGEFWDEEGIRKNKDQILNSNGKIKEFFNNAYRYLAAAGELHKSLNTLYQKALKREEIYKNTASIIHKELAHRELSSKMGKEKRFFASALTPEGFLNEIDSLIRDCRTIYLIEAPVGLWGDILIDRFKESALMRGFDTESYYCPMAPEEKIEHLLIPELSIGFVTSNRYHKINSLGCSVMDMRQYLKPEMMAEIHSLAEDQEKRMNELLEKGIQCIRQAKSEHDVLEEQYVPHMDFERIGEKCKSVLEEIKRR